MNPHLTDITIILDRSGSMSILADDTIGGYNRFLRDQQAAPGQCRLTLNQFDHEFITVHKAKDIRKAPALTPNSYVPRGNTALLDAVGRSINETGARLATMDATDRPAKVMVVIITDGYENASREFNIGKVREMITHQTKQYNWQFIFLGSDLGGLEVAAHIGIAGSNVMHTANNIRGTQRTYAAVSAKASNLRAADHTDGAAVCCAVSFTEDERAAQDDARNES